MKKTYQIINAILKEIALDRWPPFVGDRLFWLAMVSGAGVWLVLWLTVAPTFLVQGQSAGTILLLGVVYYPVLEEILFRGVMQGWMLKKSWGNSKFLNLTYANWLTSFVFVFAHFWYQQTILAFMVLVPSLVFGFFRDRYDHVFPGILLHAFYNGGFLLVNLMTQ